MFIKALLIFLGGGIGAVLRYLVNILSTNIVNSYFLVEFPLGTLISNLLGSFAIGFIAGLFSPEIMDSEFLQLFLVVGILGGFTTFSSFSIEILNLLQSGNILLALGYISVSVFVAVVLTFTGFKLATII